MHHHAGGSSQNLFRIGRVRPRISPSLFEGSTDALASFINHYIFPGGYLPSITELLNHITQQSKGTLIVEKVENIGGHYAKALRLWKENFLGNFDTKIKPALLREHPEMSKEGVEVFRRKWEVGIPHMQCTC